MIKSGRVLNDWPVDDGGIPPDLKSIRTSPEKINAFVEALLGHHRNIDIRMKKFLTANGIRFLTNSWMSYSVNLKESSQMNMT